MLAEKVALLAAMLRKGGEGGGGRTLAYTGAGISVSAGISDYATRGVANMKLLSPYCAAPTPAYHAMAGLHGEGLLHHW